MTNDNRDSVSESEMQTIVRLLVNYLFEQYGAKVSAKIVQSYSADLESIFPKWKVLQAKINCYFYLKLPRNTKFFIFFFSF